MSTTKILLASIVLLGSASLAQAQGFDPNLANRYPSYAEPGVYGYSSNRDATRPLGAHSLQSRDVSSPRHEAPVANEAWMDRASQNFDGGGF